MKENRRFCCITYPLFIQLILVDFVVKICFRKIIIFWEQKVYVSENKLIMYHLSVYCYSEVFLFQLFCLQSGSFKIPISCGVILKIYIWLMFIQWHKTRYLHLKLAANKYHLFGLCSTCILTVAIKHY